MPSPEKPEQAPPSPDFVPEPVYPEFMPPENDVFLTEEQPLLVVVSPTTDSPCYIIKSIPEEDLKEDDEDPADYPTNKDDDNEEEEKSFGDDADDEEEDKDEDDEEEEDHLAPADSIPPLACRTTAMMSIWDQTPIPFPSTAEIDRFLAISTPPSSPLISYSSPLPVSSPLLVSPPPLPASPTHPLGYRAAMIRLRAESPSTSHPLPLPNSCSLSRFPNNDIYLSSICDSAVTLSTHIPLRANLGVLQIGIRAKVIEKQRIPRSLTRRAAPPLPYFVPESGIKDPKFMLPENDVFPTEEQPLLAVVSPTADSPADYPTDRDDDDKEEEKSSRDDADDLEETKTRIVGDERGSPPSCLLCPHRKPHVVPHCHMFFLGTDYLFQFSSTAEIDRFLAISTPPSSPLISYSSPLPVSSPLLVSPPPLPASPTYPLGYRAAMICLRAESPSTSHPLPLPSPIILPHTKASMAMMRAATPSTYILASRSEIPLSGFEVGKSSSAPTARPTREFRRDYGFVATLDDEIRRDLKRDVGYGITDTWDEMVEDMQGTPAATDVAGLSQRMIDFVMTVRQDTDEIYGRLDDAQDDRSLMSCHVNLLRRINRWIPVITARSEVIALWTTVLAQQTEIWDLCVADRMRQKQLTEALTLVRTLQTQMAAL
ncbi:hypothetical protein Tco_0952443 [Tanacetum coccineum]|uniref:Uncharacterized protein n=1 Tax=Tanacetum coccineum TaxID=301880 RepID=A0ABQ5DYV0_9ASTR